MRLNGLSALGVIFAGAMLAAGCVKETRPVPVMQATQATTEIPQQQLLDVGVHIFDPGIPLGPEARRLAVAEDPADAEPRRQQKCRHHQSHRIHQSPQHRNERRT